MIGLLLAVVVAAAVFAWDRSRRDRHSLAAAEISFELCYAQDRKGPDAQVTVERPECLETFRAHESGSTARMGKAALVGGAGGMLFAVLFFAARGLRRARRSGD